MAPETQTQTNGNEYYRIGRDEFESKLMEYADAELAEDSPGSELVYDIPLPVDHLTIRVFSTLQPGQDAARDRGSDSIKCVVWNHDIEKPVGGRKRTHRLPTWFKNLKKKIADIAANWRDYDNECPQCGRALYVRDGQYGEFLACPGYPACDHTESL